MLARSAGVSEDVRAPAGSTSAAAKARANMPAATSTAPNAAPRTAAPATCDMATLMRNSV